eukprot:Pgem_evm1s19826
MMTPKDKEKLEIIQNKAMRLIAEVRQADRIKIKDLLQLTNLPTIEQSSLQLIHNCNYLQQATSHNEVIIQLPVRDYHHNGTGRNMKEGTPYDKNCKTPPTALIGILNESKDYENKEYTKEKITEN